MFVLHSVVDLLVVPANCIIIVSYYFFPCENDDAASNHKKVVVIALVVSIALFCGLLVAGLLLVRAQRKRARRDKSTYILASMSEKCNVTLKA